MKKKTIKRQPSEGMKMLQVPIDVDLHRNFKALCVQLNVTMAEKVEELIRRFMKGGQ
jgi:hypothetical protein